MAFFFGYISNKEGEIWNLFKLESRILGKKVKESNLDVIEELDGNSVNVASFGADEVAGDNSKAFADSINYIKNVLGGKGKIILPEGKTFKFKSPIGYFNVSNVEIDLNGSTLDFSSLPARRETTYLSFEGTYGPDLILKKNVKKNTKVLMVGSTRNFSKDDMVRIYSNKEFDSTRTSSRLGEISFIDSVDSDKQVTLKTAVNFEYRISDKATIQKINPVENIYIHNGTIKGTDRFNEHCAIELKAAKDCLIDNIKTESLDKRHYVFIDCVHVKLTNSSIKRAVHKFLGYGVSFVDSTMDCICSGCHFEEVRHSLSTNNNISTSWGQPRRLFFINNTIRNSTRSLTNNVGGDAVDTHAGAEDIFILGNFIRGSSGHGINFEARSGVIANNFIEDTESSGIYVNPRSDFKSKIIINENQLKGIGKNSINSYGICVILTAAGCESCTITNNQIESQQQAIRTIGAESHYFDGVVIQGNEGNVNFDSYGIQAEYVHNGVINSNSIKSPRIGIYCHEHQNTVISGNNILLYGSGTASYGIRMQGQSAYSVINGNTIKDSGRRRASAVGVAFTSTVISSGVYNNIIKGFETSVDISIGKGNVKTNNT